jgi:hypothetical protein
MRWRRSAQNRSQTDPGALPGARPHDALVDSATQPEQRLGPSRPPAADLVTEALTRPRFPEPDPVTEVLTRTALPTATRRITPVLDPTVAAADPFRDTTVLSSPSPVVEERSSPGFLLSRERAAEVGMYCGATLILVAVLGIAARQWEQWDGVERLLTTSLAATGLILGGIWLRAPWARPAGAARLRGVSVMLSTGVVSGAAGTALLFGLGQGSDPLAGVGHALAAVALLTAVNAVARAAFSETALLAALTWLGWVALPAGSGLWLGLVALGVGWAGLGLNYARGRRTAAAAGAALALTAAAALAAQPGAWVARAVLAVTTGAALGAFRTGRPPYWLALGAAAACALAAGTAADALSPAPALLAGGLAMMAVSGIALRSEGDDPDEGGTPLV